MWLGRLKTDGQTALRSSSDFCFFCCVFFKSCVPKLFFHALYCTTVCNKDGKLLPTQLNSVTLECFFPDLECFEHSLDYRMSKTIKVRLYNGAKYTICACIFLHGSSGFVRSWKTWKSHGIFKWLFPGLEKSRKKTLIIKVWEKSWKCVIITCSFSPSLK